MKTENIDIVVSFDGTGSMSQCIRQVRKNVKDMCQYLFTLIPNTDFTKLVEEVSL